MHSRASVVSKQKRGRLPSKSDGDSQQRCLLVRQEPEERPVRELTNKPSTERKDKPSTERKDKTSRITLYRPKNEKEEREILENAH